MEFKKVISEVGYLIKYSADKWMIKLEIFITVSTVVIDQLTVCLGLIIKSFKMIHKHTDTPKIKFLNKFINENLCLSQKLKYFFKVIHIYLCLDFGFMKFKSLKAKMILRAISGTQCLFFCAFSVASLASYDSDFIKVWYICYTIEFFLYVIVTSFLQSDKSFCDLQNDLLAIDSEIEADSKSYNLEFKLIFSIFAAVAIRFIYSYVFSYFNNGDLWMLTLTILLLIPPYLANDIMMIIYSFTFHSVIVRVEKFKDYIQKNRRSIVTSQYIYMSMIDSTEKAMKTFQINFVICLLCNTPQVMMTVYFVLALVQNRNVGELSNPSFVASALTTIVQALFLILLPSYYAGKLVSEYENLKLILHKILLRESDPTKTRDLKRFIKYIEARPFKFTVLKIIPVDWTLPVLIINICVTYLIVAIQFTHLY